jgi:predicted ester cyclase
MSIEATPTTMEAYWKGHSLEHVAENAVFIDMGSGVEARGREAIGQMLSLFFQTAFEASAETTSTLVGDGQAAWEGVFTGKHVGEFAGIPATGRIVRAPYCVTYEVADGKITRARIYMTAALVQQLTA